MKTKYFASPLSLLALCALLSACDKGRGSLAKIEESFKGPLEGPITMGNFNESKTALTALLLVGKAHENEGSGKDALLRAETLAKKMIKFGDELFPLTQKCLEASKASAHQAETLMNKIQKDVIQKKTKPRDRLSLKEGECFATEHSKEFDDKWSLDEVEIKRVEKLGQKAALVKTLYTTRGLKDESTWKSRLDSLPAEEKPLAIIEILRPLKLDCTLAAKAAENYQLYATQISKCSAYSEKLEFLTNLMKTFEASKN